MSLASTATIWTIGLGLAVALLAVHLRFTPNSARLSALPLLCGGVLGPLLALMLDPAALLSPASASLRMALAPLLIGIAGAASVRIRYLIAGMPDGTSSSDLLAAIEAHGRRLDLALSDIRGAQAVRERAAEERSRAMLAAALHDVIDDFHQRINGQFRQQLATLQVFVTDTGALLEKHRTQQLEAMHHARRSADQISRSVQEFHMLLARSGDLAAQLAQVGQALELLSPHQEAVAAGLDRLAHDLAGTMDSIASLQARFDDALEDFAQRSRRQLDGVAQRMGQHTGELQQALRGTADQTRAHIADVAGKQHQQMTAMNKELSEALGKPLAAIHKQLSGMQSKLNTDLAPMAQQIRRVADLSKR